MAQEKSPESEKSPERLVALESIAWCRIRRIMHGWNPCSCDDGSNYTPSLLQALTIFAADPTKEKEQHGSGVLAAVLPKCVMIGLP